MIEQPQTKLEKAEIASVGAMDDPVPSMLHGVRSEIDDPAVGETSGDHQSGQARRIGEMAFLQMKSAQIKEFLF